MLNLTKILETSLQQSFKLAFARNFNIQVQFINNLYQTNLPQTFADYYKQHYQIEWKETLLPRDIAHEILVHFQSPIFNNIKLISHIEITQMGYIQFQINKQYYQYLQQQIDTSNQLEIQKVYNITKIYGPFLQSKLQLNSTDLRGIHIKNRLFSVLSKFSQNCYTYDKINENIKQNDYIILPAKIVC